MRRTAVERTMSVVPIGIIAALLAASAWLFLSAALSGGPLPVRSPFSSLERFADWPALYEEGGGDSAYRIPLSFVRGLVSEHTTAKGEVVVDFNEGRVSVSVEGLPSLSEGAAYEVLLVDNLPGPGNSAALDETDDVIVLGTLAADGGRHVLEAEVDVARLERFQADMAVLRRVGSDGEADVVLIGLTSLFYKWNRAASAGGVGGGPGVARAAPATGVSPGVLATLVSDGDELFNNGTFDGNGRTCATCHRANNNLTIDPDFIATLPASDLLFVNKLNGDLTALENPEFMEGPRGLILENIDGFDKAPNFRAPPPMFNLDFTGPYGLSGEFATIPDFTTGAVMQHFPLTLARVAGADFTLPTQPELDAMEAFQLSLFLPTNEDFTLDNFISTQQEQDGKDLFFGATAKCSECHGGTVLSDASAGLGGGNQEFNTGVSTLAINSTTLFGSGPLPDEAAGDSRAFSTPPLFNVANTAPFFHDNSVQTLNEAVTFYDGIEFNASPAAATVGTISLTTSDIDDIVAFLETLVEPPPPPVPGVTPWLLGALAVVLAGLLVWRRPRPKRASGS